MPEGRAHHLRALQAGGGWWIRLDNFAFGPLGRPDIVGIRQGRMVAVWVRRRPLRPPQQQVAQAIAAAGGIVIVAPNSESVLAALEAVDAQEELDLR